MAEKMSFSQIFAGEVNYITRVKVAAGTYKRGDLLECAVTNTVAETSATATLAATFGQCATKSTAVYGNEYVVCAEDKTLSAAGEVVVYKEGYFNKALIMLKGGAANDNSVAILKTKNIFLETVK